MPALHSLSPTSDQHTHTQTQPHDPPYDLEFRSTADDGWYGARVVLVDETLVVKLQNFTEANDEKFSAAAIADVDKFVARFRTISAQLQDNECGRVLPGMTVCAAYTFSVDDVRYYDAVVDSVERKEHSLGKEEECKCKFMLYWLHGPKSGIMTATSVASICIVEPSKEIDNTVASFSIMAKNKIYNSIISGSGSVGNASPPENGTVPSSQLNIKVKQEDKHRISLGRKEEAGRISKHDETNRQDIDFTMAGRVSKCPENNLQEIGGSFSTGKDISSSSIGEKTKKISTLTRGGVQIKEEFGQFLGSSKRKEDSGGLLKAKNNPPLLVSSSLTRDPLQARKEPIIGRKFLSQAGGTEGLSYSEKPENRHFIIVDNLEKDLASSSIMKFISKHTSTSSQACVFPSLSWESYARGVIETDSEKKHKEIYKFLNNPDHIVTSSKGRPWVIHEEPSSGKILETAIGGVTSILQDKKTGEELKIVGREAQEYRAAKRMRDLFLKFGDTRKLLHKKLRLEEKKVSQLVGDTNNLSKSSHSS